MPKKKNNRKSKSWIRCLKKEDRGIVDFIKVITHFFKELPQWINEMNDPRHQSYIKYLQSNLVFMGILKNVCGIESMNQMNENFNEVNCIETLSAISGDGQLSEMPDGDTLNYYLSRLSPEQLSEVRRKMICRLIRTKLFNRYRLLDKYWQVVIDGTGIFYFKERHCEHCLTTTHTDDEGNKTTRYYHKVVEIKLILADSLVLSLGSEFIENETANVTKQDCETNAAKRLLERIKQENKRLPVCLLGDSLFLTEPMMKICVGYGWKYIINFKEGSQKNIYADYNFIKEGGGATFKEGISDENGDGTFVNHVEELSGKTETFNVFEYQYQRAEKNKFIDVRYMWVSNIELTRRNLEEMVNVARNRWKIENEGFNNQKNGIYKIEHINSYDSNAMKNHYLLTQISDILMQLYLNTNKLFKELRQSIKNTSSRLLESFRRQPITDEDVSFINKYTTMRLFE